MFSGRGALVGYRCLVRGGQGSLWRSLSKKSAKTYEIRYGGGANSEGALPVKSAIACWNYITFLTGKVDETLEGKGKLITPLGRLLFSMLITIPVLCDGATWFVSDGLRAYDTPAGGGELDSLANAGVQNRGAL